MFSLRASLVQLVERRSPKPDVGGSSPPGRALPFFYKALLEFVLKYIAFIKIAKGSQELPL